MKTMNGIKDSPFYKDLKGSKLRLQVWKREGNWSHDHCPVCHKEISDIQSSNVDNEGYADERKFYWVCKDCFHKYKKDFEWSET